jgi:hypothetical protein
LTLDSDEAGLFRVPVSAGNPERIVDTDGESGELLLDRDTLRWAEAVRDRIVTTAPR